MDKEQRLLHKFYLNNSKTMKISFNLTCKFKTKSNKNQNQMSKHYKQKNYKY